MSKKNNMKVLYEIKICATQNIDMDIATRMIKHIFYLPDDQKAMEAIDVVDCNYTFASLRSVLDYFEVINRIQDLIWNKLQGLISNVDIFFQTPWDIQPSRVIIDQDGTYTLYTAQLQWFEVSKGE